MIAPEMPDEADRLDALQAFGVLDTLPEPQYDDLTRLAATICGTPIALVSLVAPSRQWFKSRHGLDAVETHRDVSFCSHAILQDDLFVVPDAVRDVRFEDNSLVTSGPLIRFYAGMPLTTPEGHNLGTLCVIDRVPRVLTEQQQDALRVLARQVVTQLVLRRLVQDLKVVVAVREKAEADLRESEERFRAFMDHTPAVAFMKDEEGRYVYVNEPLTARFGIPAERWIGRTDAELWPEDVARPLRETDRKVMTTGETLALYETVPTADGESYHWQVFKFPFTDGAGRRFLAGMAVDRTAEKKAEDALRQSEERFRSVVEEMAEGVVLLDRVSRKVLRSNGAFLDQLGYTAPELAALTQYDFVAHDRADVDAKMELIESRGRASIGFRKYRRKDGSVFEVTVSGSVLTLDGRTVLCLVVQDMTELKKTENALRESEERFRSFMDNSPVLAFMKDEAGRYTYVNDPIVRRFGMRSNGWIGKTDEAMFPIDYSTTWRDNDRRVLAGDGVVEFSESVPLPDGGVSHWTTYKFPFTDGSGKRYLAGIGLDVTEKKKVEDALRSSEMKFRTTVDRLAEGLFVVDLATRTIVDANAAVLSLLGYTSYEFLSLDPFGMVAKESWPTFDKTLQQMDEALARDGRFDLGRRRLLHKNKSVVLAELRVTLVPNGGAGLHAVIVRDVSEQARYENRLLEYQSELEEANAKLQALATTDGLTGAKNRAAFNAKLTEEYNRATRHLHPLSVILMDVDHFKLFNDTFGHPAGDDVLKGVARTLQGTARTSDFVARYGGEEFVVILPDTDFCGAMALAERFRRAVAGAPSDKRRITVSVGVATLTKTTTDAATMIQEADEALYRSKQAGRNRVNHCSNAISILNSAQEQLEPI